MDFLEDIIDCNSIQPAFNSRNYREWEDKANRRLAALGYTVVGWFTAEGDSFGPLVRAVNVKKGNTNATFYYG